ncbi:MAG: shikimate dehydrogenase [Gemmatimonadaceae bacterium]|nr:shikimate dehydrogenase [Gemmatimonadaceae bacterium]
MTAPLPGRLVLLGHPVSHSLSPAFQNAALRAAGIPLAYEALDVPPDALSGVLQLLLAQRAAGNVTIPHKDAVYRACAARSELAERAGAVNTFWVDATGRLVGDNTDVHGIEALADALGVERASARVALLGSGGSASAVCAAIERWPGAQVRVFARTASRSAALAARFPALVRLAGSASDALSGATLVINATPVGMRDDALPLGLAALPRDARVMDLVYRPGETRWVREARAAGHAALDGIEMLLHQGARSFERWFARAADLAVMRDALQRAARP